MSGPGFRIFNFGLISSLEARCRCSLGPATGITSHRNTCPPEDFCSMHLYQTAEDGQVQCRLGIRCLYGLVYLKVPVYHQ
ncbi:hypothetical protein GDO81_002600 [Engystomops pustulosus]|uniref:Uncharacterized protein n=1 Tax=Engystomops pustulosus TaxID=76066 RepID=A0AAV7DLJ4_ENGPU|nr:hypothetical protein GDO81_002600 [Engystomops pustulosus]